MSHGKITLSKGQWGTVAQEWAEGWIGVRVWGGGISGVTESPHRSQPGFSAVSRESDSSQTQAEGILFSLCQQSLLLLSFKDGS